MINFDLFRSALPLAGFLERYGSPEDAARWATQHAAIAFTPEQERLLKAFTRRMNVLFLAGAWCGDCAAQCPILERCAELVPGFQVRYLDRDEDPGVRHELSINGGHRVPVALFFSEDGHEVARFGERTLADYRKQVAPLVGTVWPEQNGVNPSEHRVQVVSDWLHEIERVQWILRLSPRLRKLHSD